jgi:Tectonin domain
MLTALVAGSGLVASAAVSLISGASQQKTTDAALTKVRETEEKSKNNTKEVVATLAPSVVTLGEAVQDTSRMAQESVAKRMQSVNEVNLPLIGAVEDIVDATRGASGNVNAIKSDLSEMHARLDELDAYRRTSAGNGASSNDGISSSAEKIRGEVLASGSLTTTRLDGALRDVSNIRDRFERGLGKEDTDGRREAMKRALVRKPTESAQKKAVKLMAKDANARVSNAKVAPPKQPVSVWKELEGRLARVSTDGKLACGVTSDDRIFCAPEGSSKWTQVNGKLKQISVDNGRACGVDRSSNIFCADDATKPVWKPVPGTLEQVDVSGDLMCGVQSSGQIYCAPYRSGKWTRQEGLLHQVSVDQGRMCGVSKDDVVYCKSPGDTTWTRLAGNLKQVDLSGDRLCGVNAAGSAFCGTYKTGGWSPMGQSVKKADHSAIGASSSYLIDSSGKIFYSKT